MKSSSTATKLVAELKRSWALSGQTKKTRVESAAKACEEVGELVQAVLSDTGAHGSEYKGLGRDDVVKETVDLTTCVVAMAQKYNVRQEEFLVALTQKNDAWEKAIGRGSTKRGELLGVMELLLSRPGEIGTGTAARFGKVIRDCFPELRAGSCQFDAFASMFFDSTEEEDGEG